jgi:AcrR family transcriptional regulator
MRTFTNREEALEKPLQVFTKMNYEKATQMEIVKACGLSKAGLVYYFPFKQNLFVVIVDKYVFHPQQLEKSSNLQQVRSRSLSTSITAV